MSCQSGLIMAWWGEGRGGGGLKSALKKVSRLGEVYKTTCKLV